MNDSIVRDFDVQDIPAECFGGEETFQGYNNMMQMKSMKWRNAYLLFYERKLKEDIEFDEQDNMKVVKADEKESQNIQGDIEHKIAHENQKYWQNRFLFANEYTEFVLNIS